MVRRQPLVGDVRAERRRAGNAVPELHAGRVKAGVVRDEAPQVLCRSYPGCRSRLRVA